MIFFYDRPTLLILLLIFESATGKRMQVFEWDETEMT